MDESKTIILDLLGVLRDLLACQEPTQLQPLADSALQLVGQMLSPLGFQHKDKAIQLRGLAIALWNKVVSMKPGGTLMLSLNAQLRHIACATVLLSCPDNELESLIKKQITMCIKTGRAWLECDNPVMAETSLELAQQCFEKLTKEFPRAEKDSAGLLLRLLTTKAEVAVKTNQEESGLLLVRKARELPTSPEREDSYLSMLCYNLALEMSRQGKHQDAAAWLKESYDIGRVCSALGGAKKARTLRLLASVYLDWDAQAHWQKALNAVGLANSEHSHPSGLLLKTSILLQYGSSPDRMFSAMEETLLHHDLSMDMASTAIRLAWHHGHTDLARKGLKMLKQKLQSSPELGHLHLLSLELLLKEQRTDQALQLVQDCIANGDLVGSEAMKLFHLLLWEEASRAFSAAEYGLAVQWYNHSLAMLPDHDSSNKNLAKLHRNRCVCYLEMGDHSTAKAAVQLALQNDPDSAHSHFLAYKVAVMEGALERAQLALRAMSDSCASNDADSDESKGLLALAAQLAFELTHRDLAIQALQQLADHPTSAQQTLISLRCLVRLTLTMANEKSLEKLSLLHSVNSYLQRAEKQLQESPQFHSDAQWFMRIAWNTALQANQHLAEMIRAFQTCYQLCKLLPPDSTNINRQKTCQLMAAAASVQAARLSHIAEEKTSLLEAAIGYVHCCREICQGLVLHKSDPSMSLLAVYEFEARLVLDPSEAGQVLDTVGQLPHCEPKTYETMAALALRSSTHSFAASSLGQRALRHAVSRHQHSSCPDMERLSRCYHSMLQLAMSSEVTSDSVSREQARALLGEVLHLLTSKQQLPEMEVVWFMTKAWNSGVHLYSAARYHDAKQWCSIAMNFLPHLPLHLSSNYKQQMAPVYEEVLGKLDMPLLQPQL